MSLWRTYLTNRLIHQNHPSLDEQKCLNMRQSKNICTVCRDLCPQDVFGGESFQWDLCDNCGACVAACPSRSIRPSVLQTAAILEVCGRIEGDITLACQEYGKEADLKLPCLAALSWELAAFFALKGRITILSGHCADCLYEKLAAYWENTLIKLRSFLGDDNFNKQILRFSGETVYNSRPYSRRAALSLLSSKFKSTAVSLLPGEDFVPDGGFSRQLLIHRTRQMKQEVVCNWENPSFSKKCNACGLCARLCPSAAIRRTENEEGINVWYMAVIPWRCTGCGLCLAICPMDGIESIAPCPLPQPEKPLITAVKAKPCPRCLEPLQANEEGLCLRCKGEQGTSIVWALP